MNRTLPALPRLVCNLGSATKLAALCTALLLAAAPARADINVGVVIPMTGSASSLGASFKNGISLWPQSIAGEKLNVTILDDTTDPSTGVKNLRRLTAEDKVDVILSSGATPVGAAMGDVALETQTVQLALAPVQPMATPEKDRWIFRMPHSSGLMAAAMFKHMQAHGVKTLGFLGYSDSLGESFLVTVPSLGEKTGIRLVGTERFQRSDQSVTAQALKLVSANPDAILIVASGAGAAMPQLALTDRGYKGMMYQTHGAASRDFLRIGGQALNGVYVTAGPALVPELLADGNPSKPVALAFVGNYEKAFGAGTRNTFAAHAYDASLVLQKAIPLALAKAKPGTKEFRMALRDAIEQTGPVVVTQGVYNFSADDHWGFNPDAAVVLRVVKGDWAIEP